jgi:hypothetical protein
MNIHFGSGHLQSYVRPALAATISGATYGTWAAYVHRGLGLDAALLAGWTQVALSVSATSVLVMVLESLFQGTSNPAHGFWLAFLGTWLLGAAWLVIGHTLAGTPHILAAISPSVMVSGGFYFTYSRMLLRRVKRERKLGSPRGPGLVGGLTHHRPHADGNSTRRSRN